MMIVNENMIYDYISIIFKKLYQILMLLQNQTDVNDININYCLHKIRINFFLVITAELKEKFSLGKNHLMRKAEKDQKMERGNEACASWIRRPENRLLVVVGQRKTAFPPLLAIFSFDAKTASLSSDPLVHLPPFIFLIVLLSSLHFRLPRPFL